MQTINISDVVVEPQRVRMNFDPRSHAELAQDIMAHGLLHPPVVDKNNVLLAGERRLRAIKHLYETHQQFMCGDKLVPFGQLPITLIHDMDPITRLEAEVAENAVRVDLSWQERAAATQRVHSLNKLRYGSETLSIQLSAKADDGTSVQRNVPRALVETTASILEQDVAATTANQTASTKQDLIVAAWLEQGDADVAEAKSRSDALKIIERKLEEGHRRALSKAFKSKAATTSHTLLHGSCLDHLPNMKEGTFDCILTDPPYGLGLNSMPYLQGGVAHHYDDSAENANIIAFNIFNIGFRLCKSRAHLYMFCDYNNFYDLANMATSAGWTTWRRPLIWFRSDSTGMLPDAERGPRRTYECILFARKGDRKVLQVGNDVLPYAGDREERSAARKPVPLLMDLLRRSCLPGDLVLDPCCGSGPIFPACHELQLVATGIEQDEAIMGLAAKRIEALVKPLV